MSDGRRPDRLADRAEADRLLDAAHAGTPAEAGGPPDPLAELLAAAAAPARPPELAGEAAAMAAFRAARAAPVASPARRRRGFTAGALAWVVGVLVTATAGVAAAVTLDKAPVPPAPATPTPTTADPADGSSAHGTATGGPDRSATAGPSTSPGRPTVGAEQRVRVLELCQTYVATKPAQRERALASADFETLVEAAGGAVRVEAFCRAVTPAGTGSPSSDAPNADKDKDKDKEKEKGQGREEEKSKDDGLGNSNRNSQDDGIGSSSRNSNSN
ncbi:hypothetical protein, partial [Micromonospora sp. NPDC053811]